jgi:SMC interacting uncharacterized protein involved in chromosome segregation
VAELHRIRALAEKMQSAECARLNEQLGQARQEAQAAEVLRSEREQLRVEGDRLRSGVEELRRSLEQAKVSDREELTRLEAEIDGLAAQNRELHDRLEATQRSCEEYQRRNQELVNDLARLRPQGHSLSDGAREPEIEPTEPAHEVLAILRGIAGEADGSATQPGFWAAHPASGFELRALRFEIEDLKRRVADSERRVTDSERLQRELAAVLFGIGLRARQG